MKNNLNSYKKPIDFSIKKISLEHGYDVLFPKRTKQRGASKSPFHAIYKYRAVK